MFLLSKQNIHHYLSENNIIHVSEAISSVEQLGNCKNFNLLITLSDNRRFLVKQECHDGRGQTLGQCRHEWQVRDFMHHFSELSPLQSLVSAPIYFDADASILIFEYLHQYLDLKVFHSVENKFSPHIFKAIGAGLAAIHQATFNCQRYKEFFKDDAESPHFLWRLKYLGPQIFSVICTDGLEFLKLYQRHLELQQAIEQANATFNPCCLIHNDLRLNNILLHRQWMSYPEASSSQESLIRIIDWESCLWGDPAFDLGDLIASYLAIWLESLVVSTSISLKEALSLAVTPLECLQPGMIQLLQTYLHHFPAILQHHPDFLTRVMRFAGVSLIQRILVKVEHHLPFDNRGICMLQVAKSLLCNPEQAIPSVFGVLADELLADKVAISH
jgi:hypothetical protein